MDAKQIITIDTDAGEGLSFDLGISKIQLRFRPHRAKLVVSWEQVGEALVVKKTRENVDNSQQGG